MPRNKLNLILHVFLWLLLFIYPLISIDGEYLIYRNWLSLASIFIVFYLNYFLLIDHYFLDNKKMHFYLLNTALIIIQYFLLSYLLTLKVFHPTIEGVQIREIRSGAMTTVQLILPLVLSIGMCLGLKINARLNKNELELQKVLQNQLNTEIKYLKYQVQPHFLFNTLNNIYALIDNSPAIAKESIHSLSKMMRYLLHESSTNKIPLAKEIDFLERYINLMQLRISSNLTLEKSFPVINQPIQIAPLLLISFVENAFKHGIDAVQPSFIKIELVIDHQWLKYSVVNSLFPEKEKVTNSGIGLENLKKRLELLYPNKFELVTTEEGKEYKATLKLNLKNDADLSFN